MTLCRKGLHEMTPANTAPVTTTAGVSSWYCRACRNAWRQRRRNPTGLGFATKGQAISAGKRAAYGRRRDAGLPSVAPETIAKITAKRKTLASERRWCRSGRHPWIPLNWRVHKSGAKTCKRCMAETNALYRERQQHIATHEAIEAERQRLWQARIDAHPDRGGSSTAFVRADRAWKKFLNQQASRRKAA
jgi:hypothetical protein